MSEECIYPLCRQNIKPGSDMCFMHDLKFGAPKMKAKPKPIPAKSKKRIVEDKIYKTFFYNNDLKNKIQRINKPYNE